MQENKSVFGNNLQNVDIPDFFVLSNLVTTASGKKATSVDIMPGGLTNKNFKITLEDGTAIAMRVAGYGTAGYINRPGEKHNASLMASIGIAPEIYYYDTETGSQLCEYIDADTMHPDDFINRSEVLTEAAVVMRKYHDSGCQFKSVFNPIAKIMEYLDILKGHNFTEMYKGFDKAMEKLEKIKAAYEKNPPKLVPCHNDTLAENFMYDGKVMRVIDWEYSGMNDGFYDVACVIVENPLNTENENALITAYVGAEPNEEQKARTLINKFLVNTHWSIWSLVQICYGKDHDFYWEYGLSRADFFNEYMADPNFDRYIDLIG
ncbi:choline/ethanolamine kinase family protein [Desulfosporosinus sp. BICA1-9]|uniref:choline/ethanolamine kinase family protein n=1 Tax=Desulfosporosinus sp. BICA1-9 TaxID=1531958 RepID=UPI00054BF4AC|nr:choline/ethanolamine kinase family protein [Desulfosporosinus sp. BICA1-9]KJS49378.1 MAG: choline kinase [Peptococcaceae bacterium BRH_c23]KJS87929.1 MAG: choline kinase [Desulfosporosinus sp. BICA1-9]HBW35780.1 choline kinase [Desulfosporosinus sp.]